MILKQPGRPRAPRIPFLLFRLRQPQLPFPAKINALLSIQPSFVTIHHEIEAEEPNYKPFKQTPHKLAAQAEEEEKEKRDRAVTSIQSQSVAALSGKCMRGVRMTDGSLWHSIKPPFLYARVHTGGCEISATLSTTLSVLRNLEQLIRRTLSKPRRKSGETTCG
nr:hypothetical protein Iba_chr03aCG3550 [Ipomoea batatas]